MSATSDKLSQTMRIDLIPDVPAQPVPGRKKQVLIAPPTQKHKRVPSTPSASKTSELGEDARFRELLQSAYDAAILCDLSGRIDEANVRAIEFLHYTLAEIRSLSIFEVVSGSDEELLRTLWENLENERFTLIQAYCVRKDGTYFPAEISVNRLTIGKVQLCFFIRDTTLRRQAEEMLRTEHNAIQNAGNGIAVVNLLAQLEYVNPAVARMWGYPAPESLLGQDVRLLMADAGLADELVRAVMQDSVLIR
jgi:PAS domain S-box-containing protein